MSDDSLPTGRVSDRRHLFPVRVYFEDCDPAGIVYHANYLRFMERARTEMLRVVGIDHGRAVRTGEGAYAVADMTIRWRRPARLDDELVVVSRLIAVRAAACRIGQTIVRGDETITEAELTAAFLDPAGRPRRQPSDWIATFKDLLDT